MNLKELKEKGLYNCPTKFDNNQEKKFMPYQQYVRSFLVEEPKELSMEKEKLNTFMIAWRSIIDRGLAKMEALYNFSLLDIRTKTGVFPETMWNEHEMKSVFGVDMVQEWVDYARSKGRPVGYYEDLTEIPYADNSFDIVYSYKTFGRVKDNQLFLKELCRLTSKFLFLVLDDMARDAKLQYATTTDIRFYKQWLEIDSKVVELNMTKNPFSKNQDELLVIIYKHGGVNYEKS